MISRQAMQKRITWRSRASLKARRRGSKGGPPIAACLIASEGRRLPGAPRISGWTLLGEQCLVARLLLGGDPVDLGPQGVDQRRIDAEVLGDPLLPRRAGDI